MAQAAAEEAEALHGARSRRESPGATQAPSEKSAASPKKYLRRLPWFALAAAAVGAVAVLLMRYFSRFEDTDDAQVEANLEQARFQRLGEATASARIARIDLGRSRRLVESDSIAREDLDARQANADSRIAEVAASRAAVAVAQAELDQARLDLAYTQVRAPVGGIVGQKQVNVGDRIQAAQELLAIVQVDNLWITANYKESQVRRMRQGPARRRPRRRPRADVPRAHREPSCRDGSPIQPFAARECHRQLRQGRAAPAGPYPARAGAGQSRPAASGDVGRAEGLAGVRSHGRAGA
ncbi:MAG TPA: efflux RND transporter periplasmic adaptor subunit [Polyangiaceae bacterium]|nr:efflux RND transporter periplasmic adaptor subunit [Polyangiaceae bacterium]